MKIWGNADPNRDVIRLFIKYTNLLPVNGKSEALYKYPLSDKKLTGRTWYSDKPVGVNSLKKIVSSLAKEAGLVGHYTNHSLRATAATRMYNGGVDEQVIKEITGHKSNSVHAYKHTSEGLLKKASLTIVHPEHDQTLGESDSKFLLKLVSQPLSMSAQSGMVTSSNEFNIDKFDLPKVSHVDECVVENSRVPLHPGRCPVTDKHGNCPPICQFLNTLEGQHQSRAVKKMHLSLKYRKK